jgi:DNA sulfur modification protein DndB
MGTNEYFTANFPMGMVVKLFAYDPDKMAGLAPEQRHQRALKKARIPEIAEYVLANENYMFSSITVSVDAEKLTFEPSDVDENVGLLKLPMDAEWIVNDGQHRVAGIAEAMTQDSRLKNDSISVVILRDGGLEQSQQIFSDLNRTVQKTSKSLDILFDHRSPINRVTNACVQRVPLFRGRTDKERVSLSARSSDFTTLSALQAANAQLLGELDGKISSAEYSRNENLAVAFWEHLTTLVRPWSNIADGTIKPPKAREDYLSSYALVLWAIGSTGRTVMDQAVINKVPWQPLLQPLGTIDWRKKNRMWQHICMVDEEVITRVSTRRATADLIRWKLGLGPKPSGAV